MTYLYRAFDDSGRLLYVGITENLVNRFGPGGHEQASWTDDVANISAERYPARSIAEKAERDAIKAERPLWNVRDSADAREVALKRRGRTPAPDVDSPEWDEHATRRWSLIHRLRSLARSATQTQVPAPDPKGAA